VNVYADDKGDIHLTPEDVDGLLSDLDEVYSAAGAAGCDYATLEEFIALLRELNDGSP